MPIRSTSLEVAVLAASVAILWLVVARPLAASSSDGRAALRAANERLEQARALASCEPVSQSRIPDLEARVQRLEALVPDASDTLQTFERARAHARDLGLQVVADKAAVKLEGNDLVRLRKEWTVKGASSAVLEWVGWIEARERLLFVTHLALRRTGTQGQVRADLSVEWIQRPDGRKTLATVTEAGP